MMPRKSYTPTGNPRGRPEHVPNDILRRLVTLGIGCRMNQQDIARAIGVTHETMHKHYSEEIAGGKAMTDLLVADSMIKNIVKGDTALIKFYMINQMGFKEKTELDVKQPITHPEIAIREFNRVIAESALRSRTIEHSPPVQDRLVLSADGNLPEE